MSAMNVAHNQDILAGGINAHYIIVNHSDNEVAHLELVMINPDQNSPVAALRMRAKQYIGGIETELETVVIARNDNIDHGIKKKVSTVASAQMVAYLPEERMLHNVLSSRIQHSLRISLDHLRKGGMISEQMAHAADKFKRLIMIGHISVTAQPALQRNLLKPIVSVLKAA